MIRHVASGAKSARTHTTFELNSMQFYNAIRATIFSFTIAIDEWFSCCCCYWCCNFVLPISRYSNRLSCICIWFDVDAYRIDTHLLYRFNSRAMAILFLFITVGQKEQQKSTNWRRRYWNGRQPDRFCSEMQFAANCWWKIVFFCSYLPIEFQIGLQK